VGNRLFGDGPDSAQDVSQVMYIVNFHLENMSNAIYYRLTNLKKLYL